MLDVSLAHCNLSPSASIFTPMNTSWLRSCLAVVIFTTGLNLLAANNGSNTQTAQKNLTTAEKELQTAKQNLKNTERDLQQAQSAVQTATKAAQSAFQSAYKKQADTLGLTQALAERDQASKELSQKKTALLTSLKSSSRYKDAETAATEASAQAAKVRDDAGLSDDQRQKQLSDLAVKQRQAADLEHAEVENNPDLVPLRQRYTAADTKCRQLQAQATKAAEEDESVRTAKTDITVKTGAAKDSQQKVTAAQKEISQAEKGLQQDEQKLQQAKMQKKNKKKN